MCGFGAALLLLGSLFRAGLSCYQCFIDPDESARLCWGLIVTEHSTRSADACYTMLDRIFNKEQKVIDAAKVGRGSDAVLKEILRGEVMPIIEQFDQKMNNDTVYEAELQAAADKFITMAYGLPRASGCFPPCGFQALGAVYNCLTCQYDTCEFPLDCPPQEITVEENNRTQMWCKVPFLLPSDFQIVWRYTEVKTVWLDRFKEVTVGVDKLYSIPSARPEHSGTYQCEIFSEEHSLVRIYFHLKVVPGVSQGHAELQDVFDQALLPAGQFPLKLPRPPFALVRLPGPELLTVCLTSLLLLLFLTLGVLVWTFYKRKIHVPAPELESHRKRCVFRTA
ncbi:sperm acrosome associated 6 [Astyanax mexicanus]|uniref:Sperm acrosome associated 6 n=1 Tax=Astyanax mexicanus TaxID=7994 RepID=A0A8B9JTR6_ASTMX|nr:sperm acrosome associated 6 [Astyanax mexicanus]KAG9275918.1 sperm acrosome membrane-associated protein 6 [Astyanax mexicanus]